jgi:hypothetical protein
MFAILFLIGGITSIVAANFAMYAMVGQVNARLPEKQRFSFLGFFLAKNHRIIHAYKELYPEGRLLWWYRGCISLTIVFLAIAAYNDK